MSMICVKTDTSSNDFAPYSAILFLKAKQENNAFLHTLNRGTLTKTTVQTYNCTNMIRRKMDHCKYV